MTYEWMDNTEFWMMNGHKQMAELERLEEAEPLAALLHEMIGDHDTLISHSHIYEAFRDWIPFLRERLVERDWDTR